MIKNLSSVRWIGANNDMVMFAGLYGCCIQNTNYVRRTPNKLMIAKRESFDYTLVLYWLHSFSLFIIFIADSNIRFCVRQFFTIPLLGVLSHGACNRPNWPVIKKRTFLCLDESDNTKIPAAKETIPE